MRRLNIVISKSFDAHCIRSVSFCNTEPIIAVSGEDEWIGLLDVRMGVFVNWLMGHEDWIN
jgi:hypothetical protein